MVQKKKMGRPKATNPKSVEYGVRFDVETEAKLRAYCEKHGISKGEAIRQGVKLLLEGQKNYGLLPALARH